MNWKIRKNYLIYFAFVPVGIDILLNYFHNATFRYFQKPLVASIYAAVFVLLAVYAFTKKDNRESNVNIKIKLWFGGVIALPLFLIPEITVATVGYYSIPLILLSIFAIFKYPHYSEICAAASVYVYVLTCLVVASIFFAYIFPYQGLTIHELRWAGALYPDLRRAQGVFNGPGILGLVSAVVATYACTRRSQWGLFLVVGIFGLFSADSRSAFLATGCAAMLLYFISRRNRCQFDDYISRPALSILGGAVVIYLSLMAINAALYQYIDRVNIFARVLQFHSDNMQNYSHAHNLFLEVFAYKNFMPQLLSYGILLAAIFFIVRSYLSARVLPIVFGVIVLVYSMFEIGLILYKLNIATFALVLSALFAGKTEKKAGYVK